MKSTLKFKFIAIVIIAALPFLLFALLDYNDTVNESKKTAIRQNALRTGELAHEVNEFIESSQHILYALALHPAIINKDRKSCDEIFSRLLLLYPNHINILSADMDGRNIGSGVQLEKASTLDYSDKEWFKKGRNGVATVNELHISKLLSQPSFMVTMPVFNNNGLQTAVLGFPVNLFSLQEHLKTIGAFTPDSGLTVIDNNGKVLLDTQNRENIGKPFASRSIISQMGKERSGSFMERDAADTIRFYSYATIEATGWKTLVGIPASTVYRDAKRAALTHSVVFSIICSTGILCSLLYSNRIGTKVVQLINGFKQVSVGNLDYKVTIHGEDEFAYAAQAFNAMIADRKIAEGEIRELASSLEKRVAARTAELMNAKSELESFSYTVSHDLQAPARHVIAFSEILLKDHCDELSGESRQHLERIRKAGETMRDMITHLLTLSTLNRQEMNRIHTDFSSLCSSIINELKESEPERRVTISIEDGLFIDADPILLEIATRNLLENAWKYTGKSAEPSIEIGQTLNNDVNCFFIKDNGCGFDMAYYEKLFVPFQRLHSDKEYQGSGVGLATVWRIVERHGGGHHCPKRSRCRCGFLLHNESGKARCNSGGRMTSEKIKHFVHFAVTIISKDRPGIVADTTEVLFRLGCNIEDSSCTMLGGDFAMILIVTHEKPFSKSRLSDEFRILQERTGLVVHLRTLHEDEISPVKDEGELCLISVYGSDQPGIVYRVTRALAESRVNITDLNTRLIGTKEQPVYVLMLEAILPAGMSVDGTSEMLEPLRAELNVEIGVRAITPVSL